MRASVFCVLEERSVKKAFTRGAMRERRPDLRSRLQTEAKKKNGNGQC